MKTYLKRGALAGAIGGVVLAAVLRILGESAIARAVSLEAARHPGPQQEMFSRGTQEAGGMLGALLYGVALGAIFSVVFAAVRHRTAARGDWRRSVILAAVAFTTL